MRIQGGAPTGLLLVAAAAHRGSVPVARRAALPVASVAEQLPLEEVWLSPVLSETESIGSCIQHGRCVVCAPGVASEGEVQRLLAAGVAACDAQREKTGVTPTTGRNRFSVADTEAFSNEVVLQCEEILLRVLDLVDERMPSVYETLFSPGDHWPSRQPLNAQGVQPTEPPPDYLAETCPTLRDLYMAGELEWSEGEPAINVYTANGFFGAHKDHLALTVLIPLTSPAADFSGGGTGFWAGCRAVDENPEGPPTTVLAPPLGTALIFGGDVTHAGMPVEAGLRSVFVASFSTRTAASAADRVNGLQGAASSTSLREAGDSEGPSAVSGEGATMLDEAGERLAADASLATRVASEAPSGASGGRRSSSEAAEGGETSPPRLSARDAKVRLRELNELLESGLVTQEEYDVKRAKVLKGI